MAAPAPTDRRLLYFQTTCRGGLAEYAAMQVPALRAAGVEVCVLCPAEIADRLGTAGEVVTGVLDPSRSAASKVGRAVASVSAAWSNHALLARTARDRGFRNVLFGAYSEYWAPLWAPHIRRARAGGVRFAAILHDPIRDFQLGPRWWHWRSIAAATSLLDVGFVHGPMTPEIAAAYPGLKLTEIPHGPLPVPAASRSRVEVRQALGLPADAPVALAFGFLRDNKNLDLLIRAVSESPTWHLVVAGAEQSATQRPAAYYVELAKSLGAAARVHFLTRMIPAGEASDLLQASDVVAITYAETFKSSSGILAMAVGARRPLLASGGSIAVRAPLEQFAIGKWIEAGSVPAIVSGLKSWAAGEFPRPEWERFDAAMSWRRNAEVVSACLFNGDSP